MKKVSMENNWGTLSQIAKELGINIIGVSKEDVVKEINEKIETPKTKISGKWYEQENAFPYNKGDVVFIESHKDNGIVGRMIEIVGPSAKKNAIKGHLINPKNGTLQKTCISIDFENISESPLENQTNIPLVVNA